VHLIYSQFIIGRTNIDEIGGGAECRVEWAMTKTGSGKFKADGNV
jgi:hypothetical protein